MLFPMMINVHSKHQYFDENLKIEREKLNTFKQKLVQFKEDAQKNIDTNNIVCWKCSYSISKLNYNYIISTVLENNKHIKKFYDDTLFPLQYLLILICYISMISMMVIFKKPIRLLLLSNFFAIINLCIHAELFIADALNVYYTIIIGICTFLFSIYVLLKILIILLTIVHYRIMKDILTNE